MDRGLLDARALVGHLVPEGSMFWFLATHRGELFADEEFADLFPSGRGRPSLPAPVAAAILTLQSLHDLSDAETAEAARCDLRWKVAVGMALDDGGFHPSTLTYWRQRLARSGRPHRINDAVRRVVEETGVLAGRRVARQVPGAAAKIQAVCTGHDYTTPGKPKIDWEDPAAKDALVSALVNDAGALVAALQDAELDERAQAAPNPQHNPDSDDPPRQWYGDSAYGTGDLRDAIAGAGHTAVIKPKPLQAAVVGGFTVDDFTVDARAGTVTCPTGHARPISITGVATSGALCGACPLRQRCTTSKTGRKLVLGDHDALLRQARRDWAQDPHLRDDYRRHRPRPHPPQRHLGTGHHLRRQPSKARVPARPRACTKGGQTDSPPSRPGRKNPSLATATHGQSPRPNYSAAS